MKTVVRWILRVLLGLLVLLIALLLLKDAIIASFAQRRLLRKTGLEVRIGHLNVGVTSPTVALKDFKAFNPPGFGGAMLLHVSEASCVLDLQQVKSNRLHFYELKLHLAELNVIKSKDGVLNLKSVKDSILTHALEDRNKTKLIFRYGGIDRLELTLEKVNYIDEQQPTNSVRFNLDVNSEVITNLQTEEVFNTWLNAFLFRMAFQQYAKNPEMARDRLDFLWDGLKSLEKPGTKPQVQQSSP